MPPIVTGVAPTTSDPGLTGPPFVSDKRLYLTRDGKVVGEEDPDRYELLVAEGGQLPLARARELGLAGEPASAPRAAENSGEADSLRQRVAELEAELSNSPAEVHALRQRVAELEAGRGTPRAMAPAPTDPPMPAETKAEEARSTRGADVSPPRAETRSPAPAEPKGGRKG